MVGDASTIFLNPCQTRATREKLGHQQHTMEANQQPESEENKLRQRLEECLHHARELQEATQPPDDLPRTNEPPGLILPLHESLIPGSILTTLFRDPKTNRTVAFKREELTELDEMKSDYLLDFYQKQGLFT